MKLLPALKNTFSSLILKFKIITDKNFIQCFLIHRLHRFSYFLFERGFKWIPTTSDNVYYVNFQQKAEYACNNPYLMPFLELSTSKIIVTTQVDSLPIQPRISRTAGMTYIFSCGILPKNSARILIFFCTDIFLSMIKRFLPFTLQNPLFALTPAFRRFCSDTSILSFSASSQRLLYN